MLRYSRTSRPVPFVQSHIFRCLLSVPVHLHFVLPMDRLCSLEYPNPEAFCCCQAGDGPPWLLRLRSCRTPACRGDGRGSADLVRSEGFGSDFLHVIEGFGSGLACTSSKRHAHLVEATEANDERYEPELRFIPMATPRVPPEDGLVARCGAYESARYGLRALRTGEAKNPGPPGSAAPSRDDSIHARIRQPEQPARAAVEFIAQLAARTAPWPSDGTIPRRVQSQKWSPVNLPLFWAAASQQATHPVVEWLEVMCVDGPDMARPRSGWIALRACFRHWGIADEQGLCDWIVAQGLVHAAPRPRSHLTQSVQEYIYNAAALQDPQVAGLEGACTAATCRLASERGLRQELQANMEMRRRRAQSSADPSTPQRNDWVPVRNLADLERCLMAARGLRPHEPTHAAAEMARAGVGAPAVPGLRAGAEDTPAPHTVIDPAPRRVRRASRATFAATAPGASLSAEGCGRPGADRLPAEPPAEAWDFLDGVDLLEEFRVRRCMLKSCPRFMRGRFRHAQRIALEAMDSASRAGDAQAEERAWKLFGLLAILLLHRASSRGSVGKAELEHRCTLFSQGHWGALLAASKHVQSSSSQRQRTPEEERRHRHNMACAKVRLEECRKARQVLTSAALAPGTQATLDELKDPEKRPEELTEDLPPEVLALQPATLLELKFTEFVRALRCAPRGASGGPGGTTNEMLKVALDDEDTAALLHSAAQRLARAELPPPVARAFMSSRMTALLKSNGRVRGIATGTAFRRLVASCIARMIGPAVEDACKPFQYALSTRAGTECVGHLFRAACDLDEGLCVLSVDGIGAFDHVRRASMLRKLAALPKAQAALPFVRLSYASRTEYVWADEEGEEHLIHQGEGGEQGDPLMPLLFSLGIHDALVEVAASLLPGEDLVAFLDDVYVLCRPERVRVVYDMLREALGRIAGIELHNGKTRIWNRAGSKPPLIDDLGGDEGAWSPAGVVILGVPVGTPDFVQSHAEERLAEEKKLLDEIAALPDAQCAWQLLTRCATPRGNYWLRTLPPSQSSTYAKQRDDALWDACLSILHAHGLPEPLRASGRRIAELPSRMGGLGLRSAVRTAPAAYWSSWADAIEMIHARNPNVAAKILERLEAGTTDADGCLHELSACADLLRHEGFDNLPSWAALRDGQRPPPVPQVPGQIDRTPGWQYFASSTRETFERTRLLLSMCRSKRALLRSQAGPGASAALEAAPTSRDCTLEPELFQAWIRRRLRWPLPLSESKCSCGLPVDELGDHFGACMASGRVKKRAPAVERVVAQICREAGARVRTDVMLRDLNLAALATDERRIEVIASGLPVYGGAQLAIDVTLRSALGRGGEPRPQTHWRDGAAAEDARADKEAKYPEIASGSRCRLVVLALETGGRFSRETVEFLQQLSGAKALSVPTYLRASAAAAFQRRWTRMLAVSAAASFIESLLSTKESVPSAGVSICREPWLQALLTEARAEPGFAPLESGEACASGA